MSSSSRYIAKTNSTSCSLNTLALPLLFYIAPRALSLYRSIRSSAYKQSIRPLPPQLVPVLTLLLLSAGLTLILLLPQFRLTNIFTLTSARPTTSTNVLFEKLASIRPLTNQEEGPLRSALGRKEGRLLYYALGPDTLTECMFCSPAELENPGASTIPLSYLVYQLPKQLTPHLLSVFLVGLVTSPIFVNNFGLFIYSFLSTSTSSPSPTPSSSTTTARWRTPFLTISIALAAADVYLLATYDVRTNASPAALRSIESVDFLHWRLRTYRLSSFALLNILLATCIYLSATNRFFINPPSITDRLTAVGQALEVGNARLWATGVVKNSVVRSAELRRNEGAYWEEEGRVWEEREVVSAIQGALRRMGREQLGALERAAAERAGVVVAGMGVPTGMGAPAGG